MKLQEELIRSVNNIKNKIRMIQNEEDAASFKCKKIFKPIIDPLETIIKDKIYCNANTSVNVNMNDTVSDFIRKDDSTIEEYDPPSEYDEFKNSINIESNIDDSEHYTDDDKSSVKQNNDTLNSLKKEDMMDIYSDLNVPFGIRSENKKLWMGNTAVKLSVKGNNLNENDKKYVMTMNNKRIELSPGLKELLIRTKPNLELVTETDKNIYKDILEETNAHKRDYNPNGQLKGDKGIKYCQIIKPMFPAKTSETKLGGSLTNFKKMYKNDTDYIYWDDPNELIERLKLLIASKCAGNSNHDNEIISIIEELKEAGIIKE